MIRSPESSGGTYEQVVLDNPDVLESESGVNPLTVLGQIAITQGQPHFTITRVLSCDSADLIDDLLNKDRQRKMALVARHGWIVERMAAEGLDRLKLLLPLSPAFKYRGDELLRANGSVDARSLRSFAEYWDPNGQHGTAHEGIDDRVLWVLSYGANSPLHLVPRSHHPESYDYGQLPGFFDYALAVVKGEERVRSVKGLGPVRGEFVTELCRAVVWEAIDLAELATATETSTS